MGMSEQAEVEALKSEVVSLEAKIDEMQTQFTEALKSMQEEFNKTLTDALTPVTEEPVAEKEEVEVEEEPAEEEEAEEVEEEEVAEEPVAEKGESKAEPVHDNIVAEKKTQNIYDALGRNPDGTRRV